MAEEAKKYEHWRNLTDNNYLRAELFAPGEKKVLTIDFVQKEKLTTSNGTVEEKPVAHFAEKEKPMVLNVTNCKAIEAVYGTGNIYDWKGKKIQIMATKTKVGGVTMPCLRVEKVKPASSEPEYRCSVCGKLIDKKLYDGSIKKYGKAYCSGECRETDEKGEKIL